jgi:hypothetical protein
MRLVRDGDRVPVGLRYASDGSGSMGVGFRFADACSFFVGLLGPPYVSPRFGNLQQP